MSGRSRRDYVPVADRLGQQRESRVRLRRHLKLVPPQPAVVEPAPRHQNRVSQGTQIWMNGGTGWTALQGFDYAATTASTALGQMSTGLRNLSTAWMTTGTSTTITLNGSWNGPVMSYEIPGVQGQALRVRGFDTPQPAPLTPEEEAARAQRLLQAEERRQEAHRRRITAEGRARDTLRSFLNPEQCADYDQHGHFYVEGSAGNLYKIERGNAGNVKYVDRATKRELASICAHPTMREEWLPDQDVALAQMLALATDEPLFTAIANVHWGIRPPHAAMDRRPQLNTPAGARRYVNGGGLEVA
jgi:hypothetical protein